MCRFDVSPSPKTNYDTVSLVRYTGTDPIRERIQSGERLRPDELDAFYFYISRAPTFCRFAKESLSENGVPTTFHPGPATAVNIRFDCDSAPVEAEPLVVSHFAGSGIAIAYSDDPSTHESANAKQQSEDADRDPSSRAVVSQHQSCKPK